MGPWAGCFEGLGYLTVSEAEVANVRNHVRQLIAFDSILGPTGNTLIFTSNVEHLFHLSGHLVSLALEKACGSAHLIGFETNNL